MKQIRQGDVFLERIKSLPRNLEKKNNILAYGEVTGHKHRFVSKQVQVFKDRTGQQIVQTDSDAELIHEEHKTVTVPKGIYRVVIQREFDIQQGVRQVMD